MTPQQLKSIILRQGVATLKSIEVLLSEDILVISNDKYVFNKELNKEGPFSVDPMIKMFDNDLKVYDASFAKYKPDWVYLYESNISDGWFFPISCIKTE